MSVTPIVVTADLPRLQAFYCTLTGATVERIHPPEGPVFYVGLSIGLGPVAEDPGAGPTGRIALDVPVASVDDALALVEGLGGTVDGPANDMPWGQRVGHVKDPDGNAVNLSSPTPTATAGSSQQISSRA